MDSTESEDLINKPVIICLTPVRNEAWILDTFLKCTSVWADYIIIADQNSDDGSNEIALKYDKVLLIRNCNSEYSEIDRQRLLIDKARIIKGKRLLITLDADEFLSSGFSETEDWKKMVNGNPGDTFAFRWINILPGYKKGWLSNHFIWALIDDNSPHSGTFIHNHRLPVTHLDRINYFDEIRVLHYQYLNWERMKSKQRYYQCLERIKNPEILALDLYRKYHHMYNLDSNSFLVLDDKIYADYENRNINMKPILSNDKCYWFDKEVLNFFIKYGTAMFRKDILWDVNWKKVADDLEYTRVDLIKDPRNLIDKLIHFWLKVTCSSHNLLIVKKIDTIIKKIW